MGDSKNLNGVTAAPDDFEKGEVLDSQEQQDLEEGEDYEAEEGDLEKRRGEVHEIEVSELLQPLVTPQEAEHHELAAASTPLVAMENVIISLIIISFVLVEAYFVGRSFRQWHSNEHVRGKPMNNTLERWEDPVRDCELLGREVPGDAEVARALFDAQVSLNKSKGEDTYKIRRFGGDVVEITAYDQYQEAITAQASDNHQSSQ